MLYLDGFVGLAVFCLWLYCLLDVLTTDDDACRNLPRLVWLIFVVLAPLAGSIVWLVAGRPTGVAPPTKALPYARRSPEFPEYDRPGRFSSEDPEADAEFLRRCRERAEQQRRQGRGQDG
ncbi:PLD nuclease N-terminal domain-containing protein [Pseudonocardia spinosispora]|uniref:PLD nuclease N-terminal domain-containing protein n=1 Tax=Pseudonocardia spinosispora TaxID=103441 RepID=UPI0003FD15C9|nr:PLD nuclease N-terminal domain-containing protein [Pseudonocardia spinosispora]